MITNSNEVPDILSNAKTYAIVAHVRPDGDAISSCLAIFWYLLSIGKSIDNIDIIIPKRIKEFDFIPGSEYIKTACTRKEYDLVIILDCACLSRIEGVEILESGNKVLCIDHHEEITIEADYCVVDSTASSCTCILYSLLKCKDKRFLECIAIGILSDTSCLRLNVTTKTESIIDKISFNGIDMNVILNKLNSPTNRVVELVNITKTRGYFVNDINKPIFCTYLLQKDLMDKEKKLDTIDHKAIILELQKIVNFTTLFLLIEKEDGSFKGSIRSFDDNIDLNSICMQLVSEGKIIKGGGHAYSAGFTAKGTYCDIFNLFISRLK